MADNIGVLELEIRDNASDAGSGLRELAAALSAVKAQTAGTGEKGKSILGLDNIKKELTDFTKAINAATTTSKVFKGISEFGKGLTDIAKVVKFSADGMDTTNIVTAISNIKTAVDGGLGLGQAGTQIKNIREALTDEWKTDNAYNAGMALSAIGEGAKSLTNAKLGEKAGEVSAMAEALTKYATAAKQVQDAVGMNQPVSGMVGAETVSHETGEGLNKGMKESEESVRKAATEVAQTIIDALKEKLDIHSPSGVGEEMGTNLDEGMAIGMEKSIDRVESAAEKVAESVSNAFSKVSKRSGIDLAEVMERPIMQQYALLEEHQKAIDAIFGGKGSSKKSKKKSPAEGMLKETSESIEQVSSEYKEMISGMGDIPANMSELDLSKLPIGYIGAEINSAKADVSSFGKMAKDAFQTNLNNGLFDSVKGLGEMQQGETGLIVYAENLERTWDHIVEKIEEAAKATEAVGPGFEKTEELMRERKERQEQEMQALAEKNYPGMREVYLSGEGDWQSSLEEKYGFTPRAFQEGETYADALRITMEEVNKLVDEYLAKVNKPAGTTLADSIEDSYRIKRGTDNYLAPAKSAKDSASVFMRADALNGSGEGFDDIIHGSDEAMSKITMLMNKIEHLQRVKEQIASVQVFDPEAQENQNAQINDLNLQIGRIYEQIDKLVKKAHEAQAAMNFEEMKKNADTLQRDYGSEMVGDLVGNYSQIEVEERKLEGMWNNLARDINQNKISPDDIWKRVGAIQKQAEYVDDLRYKEEALASVEDDRQRGYGSEMVNNLVNNYSQIDLLRMKMEGMKQALADDINQNKVDTQQIAQRTMAIQKLKEEIDGLVKKQTDAAKAATSVTAGFKETLSGLFKIMKNGVVGKLAKQFLQLAKRMAMRAIIRQLTSALKEGVENVYRYSEVIGSAFSKEMDTTATALFQMKNAIGAAVAPAIQAVLPFVNQLVNGFIEVVNKINQVFALLNGQSTWTRALPYAKKAFEDQKKATKGASDAMKDLLADWDELNIIQSQNSGGSGSAGKEAEDYAAMFEEVATFDTGMQDIASFIKDLIFFVKNHLTEILGIVTAIKWGAKLAKFSNAFTGLLGDLLGLMAAGFIIKLTIDAVSTLDKKYLETGNPGYLVADTLTTLLGGFFAKKVLKKVLGGSIAKIAIPLTFAISAGTTIKALIEDTDVSALSEKGLLSAANGALKAGVAAGGAVYSLAKLTAGTSAGVGAGVALVTLGATIGIKAIAEVRDTGSITSDNIKENFLAAGLVGGGLMLTEATLHGTAATIATVGLGGALLVLGALFAIEGIIYLSKKDAAIKWGNKRATEDQIREFIAAEMFSSALEVNLTAYSKSVELGEGQDAKITEQVEAILPQLHALQVGIDTEASIANIKSQIFDEGGLIDQYNEKHKTSIATIKAAINLVPITNKEGQDISAEYFKTMSEGWTKLSGVMDQLGKDLAKQMELANNAEMNSAARRIYENNVGILTKIMVDVNSAIASRRATSEAEKTFREGVENWDWNQQSYDDLINFYNEQKNETSKKIESAYQTYYDELDDMITANTVLLQRAKEAGLTEIGGQTIEEIQAEIDSLNEMKKVLDDNKQASIEAALAFYATGSGYELLRTAILDHLSKKLTENDVEMPKPKEKPLSKDVIKDYLIDPSTAQDIEKTIKDIVDVFLKDKLGSNFDTIKGLIEIGVLNYTDIIDDNFFEALRKRYGISEQYQAAWQQLIDQYFHPKAVEEAKNQQPPATYIPSPEIVFEGVDTKTPTSVEDNPVVQEVKDATESFTDLSESADAAKKKILTLDEVVLDTTKLESGANTAATAIEDMARRIREAFRTLDGLSYEMDISGQKFSGAMSVLIPEVKPMATGGFPKSGDLIMANENGNIEMMGRMGSRPVVANNQQIVSGISQGVANANGDVVGELRTLTTLMQRMLNKEFVARAVPSSAWGGHNARSQEAYNKVTG